MRLSIGYPTAIREATLEIKDWEMENMDGGQIEACIDEKVQEWAQNYISISWKEVDE